MKADRQTNRRTDRLRLFVSSSTVLQTCLLSQGARQHDNAAQISPSVCPVNEQNIFLRALWLNKSITIDGKDIFWTTWYKRGIMYIKVILKVNNTFIMTTEIYARCVLQQTFYLFFKLGDITGDGFSSPVTLIHHFLKEVQYCFTLLQS